MKYLMAFLVLFSLCGCLATRYQAKAWDGGYSEQKLSDSMYRVRFEGNGYTSMQIASDGFLRRCAELTLASGNTHFIILDANRDISTAQWQNPNSYTATKNYSGGYDIRQTGGGIKQINRPTHEGTVKMFSENPPSDAIDASIFISQFLPQK